MNPSPGETIFVTVATAAVLGCLAFCLNLLKASFGLYVGLAGCALLIVVALSLAFRLEAREKTRRASEDQRARLLSDLSQE
jgi:preprotein translocase subunit SecY